MGEPTNETPVERPPSERAFDGMAAVYDAWYDLPLGATVDALEKDLVYRMAGLRSGERALDVGTGTGHFATDMAARGLAVVGVDVSAAMLAMARGQVGSVRLVRGDAAALPLAPQCFDLVLSVTALEFVARREDALRQMWRALRPGGRLVVGVLNARCSWERAWRTGSQNQETPFSHAHFFTAGEFVGLLRQFGQVTWSSSVFISPSGKGLRWAWALEKVGRRLCRAFGALLVGRVQKWE